MNNKKFCVECDQAQLRIILTALEEYMRIGFGQFSDLANRLAFKGYHYDGDAEKRDFDLRIQARNSAEEVFKAAMEVAQPGRFFQECFRRKDDDEMLAEDLWAIIRHKLWMSNEDHSDCDWCTDAREPLFMSNMAMGFKVYEQK